MSERQHQVEGQCVGGAVPATMRWELYRSDAAKDPPMVAVAVNGVD